MPEPRPRSSPGSSSGTGPRSAEAVLSQTPETLANSRQCPACGIRYPADFKVCPRDATELEDALSDSEDPVVGQLLGGTYDVVRVIGEGGMGRVYEARHTRLAKKRFAIKMLHHELARQPEVVTRFQREAEASSALSHPNVVGVYDVNTAPDGRPYLVAELLEGEELGEHLEKRGKLPIEQAISIVRQICLALEVAHDLGIVHRDVKPENVFLVQGGALVKVLDFGISKIAEDSASLTKTGMVMGTPDYMAPEQARGDRVDARADIYAVGAILYRAVTGQKPFEGLDPMATLTAALVQQPPRPSALEPAIPLDLEMVIQRAMAKEPSERYQTMHELDAALAAFQPDSAAPPIELTSGTVDVRGRTMLSRPELGTGSLERPADAQTARLARPGLAFFSGLGFLWLLVNCVVAVGCLVRVIRDADLTPTEAVLVPAGVFLGLVTPLAIWIRYLAREIWPSTPRAVEVASRLRRTVLYSASAYAIAVLFIQLLETVVNKNGAGLSRPGWGLVAFQVALVVAVVSWLFTRGKRKA